jgi:hypothetical protein
MSTLQRTPDLPAGDTAPVGVDVPMTLTESVRILVRDLDPKLVSTVLAATIARRAVERLGLAKSSPLAQASIVLAVAALVGWLTPNAATVLRAPQESGNAIPPAGVDFQQDA